MIPNLLSALVPDLVSDLVPVRFSTRFNRGPDSAEELAPLLAPDQILFQITSHPPPKFRISRDCDVFHDGLFTSFTTMLRHNLLQLHEKVRHLRQALRYIRHVCHVCYSLKNTRFQRYFCIMIVYAIYVTCQKCSCRLLHLQTQSAPSARRAWTEIASEACRRSCCSATKLLQRDRR